MKNFRLNESDQRITQKLIKNLPLYNNPPKNVEEWVKTIEKKKEEIIDFSDKCDFALPQFQDMQGLAEVDGYTLRSMGAKWDKIKIESNSSSSGAIFTEKSRGIFFPLSTEKLATSGEERMKVEFIGFTDTGNWKNISVSYQNFSFSEREENKNKQIYNTPYIKYATLESQETTLLKILKEKMRTEKLKIGVVSYDVLIKMRYYIDTLVERNTNKLAVSQDFLQTMVMQEELLLKAFFQS